MSNIKVGDRVVAIDHGTVHAIDEDTAEVCWDVSGCLGDIDIDRLKPAPIPSDHKWFMGEAVSPLAIGTRMEWVNTDEATDRLHCGTFLGLWHTPGDPDTKRIAFCTMGEEGDIYALGDDAEQGEPFNPSWRQADPDQILVPVDGYNAKRTAED